MVDGGSTRTEIFNNVFRADGGYDLNIADDSRAGILQRLQHSLLDGSRPSVRLGTHDLNDISTSARPEPVRPALDRHRRGENWAAPQFVNLSADDYRTSPLVNGQRRRARRSMRVRRSSMCRRRPARETCSPIRRLKTGRRGGR